MGSTAYGKFKFRSLSIDGLSIHNVFTTRSIITFLKDRENYNNTMVDVDTVDYNGI